MNKSISLLAALGTLALLSACGGSTTATPNAQPVAHILNPAARTIYTGTAVTLDGSQSRDPEQTKLKFEWSIKGLSAASALAPQLLTSTKETCDFVAYLPDTYTVSLVVSDGVNTSQPVTTSLKVEKRALDTPVGADNGLIVAVTSISFGTADDETVNVGYTVSRPEELGDSEPIPEGGLRLFLGDGTEVQQQLGEQSLEPGDRTTGTFVFKVPNPQVFVVEDVPKAQTPTAQPITGSVQWVYDTK